MLPLLLQAYKAVHNCYTMTSTFFCQQPFVPAGNSRTIGNCQTAIFLPEQTTQGENAGKQKRFTDTYTSIVLKIAVVGGWGANQVEQSHEPH